MVSFLYFVFGLLAFGEAAFCSPNFVPLSEVRPRLTLPSYSTAERKLLLDQSLFVLDQLFVHRDLKIEHFGKGIDPIPRLTELSQSAASLTDQQMHDGLVATFAGLHDLHTNYYGPAPLACAMGVIPLQLASVTENGKEIVVVEGRLRIHPEATEGIAAGDELIGVDGKSVANALIELSAISGGANEDAIRERGIELLTFRTFASQPIPKSDSVRLQFQGRSGSYEKEIPWFVAVDEGCQNARRSRRPMRDRLRIGVNPYQRLRNRIFGLRSLIESKGGQSESPISQVFQVAPLQTPAGTVVYVRLKSFDWEEESAELDVSTVVEALRRTLEKDFTEAVGMVIDVRGNPGGLIVLAEKMVQLFARRQVTPTSVQMLANPLNEKIFVKANGGDNRWSVAVRDAIKENRKYIRPMVITPASEANELGQVWFRPVVVLTDASCYSACDLFAAGMQDMGAGVILGLHRTTGAGGANVMDYDTFRQIFQGTGNPFKPLPFGQSLRVAWRQTIRAGKNEGKLIEDTGVLSDIHIPLTRKDVGSESKELMRQIHKVIDTLQPKYQSGLLAKRGGLVLLENDTRASWTEKVWGVDTIEAQIDGKAIASIDVNPSETPKEVRIGIDRLRGDWIDQRVTLIGKRGRQQMFRVVRELKWRGEYLEIPAEGLQTAFGASDILPYFVTLRGTTNEGWKVVSKVLRVGDGPKYGANLLARAFLPIELKGKGANLEVEMKLLAEDMHDTLRMYAINPDTGDRHDLFAGSETPESRSLHLPEGWNRADLVFEFESDENWNFVGPEITRIRIQN